MALYVKIYNISHVKSSMITSQLLYLFSSSFYYVRYYQWNMKVKKPPWHINYIQLYYTTWIRTRSVIFEVPPNLFKPKYYVSMDQLNNNKGGLCISHFYALMVNHYMDSPHFSRYNNHDKRWEEGYFYFEVIDSNTRRDISVYVLNYMMVGGGKITHDPRLQTGIKLAEEMVEDLPR